MSTLGINRQQRRHHFLQSVT